jgi:hypothetical protein
MSKGRVHLRAISSRASFSVDRTREGLLPVRWSKIWCWTYLRERTILALMERTGQSVLDSTFPTLTVLPSPGDPVTIRKRQPFRLPLPTSLTNWSISSISYYRCLNSPGYRAPLSISRASALRIWYDLVGFRGVSWSSKYIAVSEEREAAGEGLSSS